jgi:hypothetical protein
MSHFDPLASGQDAIQYLGLAPFLRASIAGQDIRSIADQMLAESAEGPGNPLALMNLSIAVQCLQQKELGLALQQEALKLEHTYRLPARIQPTRLRLLVLVTEGSIQSYTPLECLLEVSDIELVFHYVFATPTLLADVPEHDVLFVGISDSDENRALLDALDLTLQGWPQPVLNRPLYLRHTGRDRASEVLAGIDHLLMPPTVRVSRPELETLVAEQNPLSAWRPGTDFPLILRPVGSQAGADLHKITGLDDVATYLAQVDAPDFFMAPFIDYSDDQGFFKKIRIALIAGQPFVCHMAVSENWMVHYVNAGMYQEAWKRGEEARFMAAFDSFTDKHRQAFDAIAQRMQLDYLVMDCAETRDGELLLFEIDHGGVVHAMDIESIFPYKNAHIQKAQQAFSEHLYGLVSTPC